MARVLFVGRSAARPMRLPAMRVEAVQVHVRRSMTSGKEKLQRLTAVAFFLLVEKAMVATGLTVYLPGTLLGMFSLFGVLLSLDASGFQKTAMGRWSAA